MLNTLRIGKPLIDYHQRYETIHGKKVNTMVTQVPVIMNESVKSVVEFACETNKMVPKMDYNNDLYKFSDFKTINPKLNDIISRLQLLSRNDGNVLIYGETGTGKEIIAQSIHSNSSRDMKPFIAQNCAAIPENLIESILFGSTKGSFTGAVDRAGLFEIADEGTLFLDELNSMPIHLQSKLLRVLEEQKTTRLGCFKVKKINVRVIATVNEKPQDLINDKRLREDLFYRLSNMYVQIPPLRERVEDICFLSELFAHAEGQARNMNLSVSDDVLSVFQKYKWPGNVRELKNLIISAADYMTEDGQIQMEYLSSYFVEKHSEISVTINENLGYHERISYYERKIILNSLTSANWNVSEASRQLGIKRQTLQHKIKKLFGKTGEKELMQAPKY